MTSTPGPELQRRRLAAELRRARSEASLTQSRVATDHDWSLSKLLRIENGQVRISLTDLKVLLQYYGITEPTQVASYLQMALESKRQTWRAYRDVLNPTFKTYLGFEESAQKICQFELTFVPGLLQTEDYARAVIHSFADPGQTSQELERQLEARLVRQEIFERAEPPEIRFVLDEAVVRRPIATATNSNIMRDQLKRLKELAATPFISIAIVPFSFGLHFGMSGPFVLLSFADADDDVLFRENRTSSLMTRSNPVEIERYRRGFAALEAATLGATELESLLDEILEQR